jgi:hypothetical protein
MEITDKYRKILVEALGDLMYWVSLDLSKLKGQPMTRERKQLTTKQQNIEDLLHLFSIEKA